MRGSRRSVARVASATSLLGALAVFASGCGGSSFDARQGPTPKAPGTTAVTAPPTTVHNRTLQSSLVRAVALTTTARTARSSISVTLTGLGSATTPSGAFDIAGTGTVDLRTGNAELSLSVPRFDRLGNSGPVEQRIVAGVAYLQAPAPVVLAGGLPASVRWLRIDPTPGRSTDPAELSQAQVDPVGQLAILGAVSENVSRVGSEPVRGVAGVHYAATVDVPARLTPPTPSAAVAKLASIQALIGAGRVRVDAWIDRAGRVRRVVVSVPLGRAGRSIGGAPVGARAMLRVQADLYAFGAALRVAAPPQAQVRPYSTLRVAAAKG
jgi:hypothetical protein